MCTTKLKIIAHIACVREYRGAVWYQRVVKAKRFELSNLLKLINKFKNKSV